VSVCVVLAKAENHDLRAGKLRDENGHPRQDVKLISSARQITLLVIPDGRDCKSGARRSGHHVC
jgi:hypothetical protein